MNINYTIIIPHKDIPQLLQRCLASIPHREDLQIIIVDDNSDPTKVDFAHFPGLDCFNVECYFTKEGKGAGYARNVGLKHARGKWLLFADADDFFHEGMLQMLDKWKDTDYDIVSFETDSADSETLEPRKNRLEATYTKTSGMLRYEWYVPWGRMIKHHLVLVNKITFDEVLSYNDVMFSTYCGHYAAGIATSSDLLYCSTVRENSISRKQNIEYILDRMRVRIRYHKFLDKHKYENVSFRRFNFQFVLILKESGIKNFLKSLYVYLYYESCGNILSDFSHIMSFQLKKYNFRIWKKR